MRGKYNGNTVRDGYIPNSGAKGEEKSGNGTPGAP
jgi:hypothetical protein